MRKICKIEKDNGITQEDDACFGPTNNRVYVEISNLALKYCAVIQTRVNEKNMQN